MSVSSAVVSTAAVLVRCLLTRRNSGCGVRRIVHRGNACTCVPNGHNIDISRAACKNFHCSACCLSDMVVIKSILLWFLSSHPEILLYMQGPRGEICHDDEEIRLDW
ncbi:hypothetical protein C8Q79DRAFT_764100 [Trametes meyenii]|nr:hypothetical protein C8Q79DRAFT_764100 [Trametes meyenii]